MKGKLKWYEMGMAETILLLFILNVLISVLIAQVLILWNEYKKKGAVKIVPRRTNKLVTCPICKGERSLLVESYRTRGVFSGPPSSDIEIEPEFKKLPCKPCNGNGVVTRKHRIRILKKIRKIGIEEYLKLIGQ